MAVVSWRSKMKSTFSSAAQLIRPSGKFLVEVYLTMCSHFFLTANAQREDSLPSWGVMIQTCGECLPSLLLMCDRRADALSTHLHLCMQHWKTMDSTLAGQLGANQASMYVVMVFSGPALQLQVAHALLCRAQRPLRGERPDTCPPSMTS